MLTHPHSLARSCPPLGLMYPSFLQHVWSSCCIPGMALGAEVTEMKETQLPPW